jgi:hypothetical protein
MNHRDLFYAVSLDDVEKGEVLITGQFVQGLTTGSIIEIDLADVKDKMDFWQRQAETWENWTRIAQRQKEELQAEVERLKGK